MLLKGVRETIWCNAPGTWAQTPRMAFAEATPQNNGKSQNDMVDARTVRRSSNWGMADLSPKGTGRPFPCLSLPGWTARPKGRRCGAEAGRSRQRTAGLGAAHRLRLEERERGHQGSAKEWDRAGRRPRGPSHLLCLQPWGRGRRESMLEVDQAGRKSPSFPTHSPPNRELPAAGVRLQQLSHVPRK